MKTLKTNRTLAFLGMLAVASCDDGTPTDPAVEELFTLAETIELDVLASTGSIDVALEMADASNIVASNRGDVRAEDGRRFHDRARSRFTDAQDDLARGDRRAAIDKARDARQLVVRSIEATGGQRAVVAMVERLEAVASTIGEDVDSFVNPAEVAAELNVIALSARDALSRGDTARAGERAVFGDQRTHDRRTDGRRGRDRGTDRTGNDRRSDVGPDRAELAIQLGVTAVALAERLLENDVLDDEQTRYLETAHELLEKARTAFAEGQFGRAVHFAEAASWSALKAVVLPGGITEEELREMVDLANLCKDHVRSPRRSDISLSALAGLLRGRSDPALDAEGAEVRHRVWDALDALTPEQREAFVLKHVEGRSYEEIAAVMDLSVASLKMRVHRARHALRGLLEEYA